MPRAYLDYKDTLDNPHAMELVSIALVTVGSDCKGEKSFYVENSDTRASR